MPTRKRCALPVDTAMNPVGLFLACLLLADPNPAPSRNYGRNEYRSIGTQLASIITYPECAPKCIRGIVMVQFQIGDGYQICRVRVHTDDDGINTHLIRQLTGRRLVIPNPVFSEIHTVKIVFRQAEKS